MYVTLRSMNFVLLLCMCSIEFRYLFIYVLLYYMYVSVNIFYVHIYENKIKYIIKQMVIVSVKIYQIPSVKNCQHLPAYIIICQTKFIILCLFVEIGIRIRRLFFSLLDVVTTSFYNFEHEYLKIPTVHTFLNQVLLYFIFSLLQNKLCLTCTNS